MTEQEFVEGLKKIGFLKEDIDILIEVYHKSKKIDANFILETLFDNAIRADERIKKEPDGFVTVD
jgi:hypothetical protein